MPGPSVTIVESGGIAVTQVESGGPVFTAVDSGGIAITLVESGGLPWMIEGAGPTPPPLAPTTDETQVVINGSTFEFDGTYPVGEYSQWFDDRFAVNATVDVISPASSVVAAGTYLYDQSLTITAVNTTTDTLTCAANGMANGRKIRFRGVGSITGINTSTDYFIIGRTATTFQVSLTSGGAAVDLGGSLGSNVTFSPYNLEYRANGATLNPFGDASYLTTSGAQGFDSRAGNVALGEYPGANFVLTYDASKNDHPTLTGLPISDPGRLVHAVSNNTPTGSAALGLKGVGATQELNSLHIVPTVPPEESFPPLGDGSVKALISEMDLSFLPSVALPGSTDAPTYAEVLTRLTVNQLYYPNNLSDDGIKPSGQQSFYGGSIACDIAQALLFLCLDTPTADQKRHVAAMICNIGLQLVERGELGGRYPALAITTDFGGGHHWMKPCVVFAAKALEGATYTTFKNTVADYADASVYDYFQSDRTIMPVTRTIIDNTPTSTLVPVPVPFLNYMENNVDWNNSPGSGAILGCEFDQRYRDVNSNPNLAMSLALRMMGVETLWGNVDYWEYLDRYYNWWVRQGSPIVASGFNGGAYFNTPESLNFLSNMVTTYWGTYSPTYQDATAPSVVRTTARDNQIWIEFDKLLDTRFIPSIGDFVINVNGSPVTPTAPTPNLTVAINAVAGTVSSATGIVRGKRISQANLRTDTFISAVSGTSVTLSRPAVAAISGSAVTTNPCIIYGKCMVVILDTDVAEGSTADIAYTQPGSNQPRALGGGLIASTGTLTATVRTGELPPAVTTIDTPYNNSPGTQALRQLSKSPVPASVAAQKRLRFACQFILNNKEANANIVCNNTASSAAFRLWMPTTANLRVSTMSQSIEMPGANTALPLDTLITMYMEVDWTQSGATAADFNNAAYKAVFKWNGGSHTANTSTSTGSATTARDGTFTFDPATMFTGGISVLGQTSTNVNQLDGGVSKLIVDWGDATLPLAGGFSGPEFDWDSDWGGNGEDVWGSVPARFYAGTIDEWNTSVINRGYDPSKSMVPNLFSAATEELTTNYVAYP